MTRIVIKVPLHSDECRRKAMETVAKLQGVSSMSIEGDQVVVAGDVDPVCLTNRMRKKFCYAALVSVEEVVASAEDNGNAGGNLPDQEPPPVEHSPVVYDWNYPPPYPPHFHIVYDDPHPNGCPIL